jgi:hypothetical protein
MGLEGTGLGSDSNYVQLADLEVGGIFANEDAFNLRNRVGEYPQEGRLSGPGSAADEQRFDGTLDRRFHRYSLRRLFASPNFVAICS